MAAVRIKLFPDDPDIWGDEVSNELVWLIEIDENYSLENVQRVLIDGNRDKFGDEARVVCEIGRVKSIKKLLAWAHRKGRNKYGLPPLTGWHGPIRLGPAAT
jgi:hypothetical protein